MLSGDVGTSAPSQTVSDDLTCAVCGYALRGLSDDASCPECGHAVRASRLAAAAMTKRDLAMILCRLLGLWFLISSVQTLQNILWWLSGLLGIANFGTRSIDMVIWGLNQAVYFGAWAGGGVILWWKAKLLSRWIIPHDGRIGTSTRMSPQTLMRVGVGLIGVWFAASGIIETATGFLAIYIDIQIRYELGFQPQALQGIIKITIGIALMIGWSRWVALWRKLRPAGTASNHDT